MEEHQMIWQITLTSTIVHYQFMILKVPSEMEVAPRYKLFTLLTPPVHC